ncbi:hypothetical protein LDENG_00047080 [Lucifuga dentata]|nr:hypothetical protein LDENG_00047080 [Lucifuga dentata]
MADVGLRRHTDLLVSLLSRLKTFSPSRLEQEYQEVRSQTLVMKKALGLTTEAGALKENIKKNRYKDILPYDQSRVLLSLFTSDFDCDYINASFIQGATADRKYIACQAPLSCTLADFWRMIWQNDVKVIVMACREIEMGKKKCECYWAALHQSTSFGPFSVYNGETRHNEDMVVRTLTVTYQQVSRTVHHHHFLSWPDHDIPYETAGVLSLLEQVRNTQGTHTSPVLVHCSAGCGRTGVICALDYIHDLLVTEQITADFSIMKVVVDLRRQRPAAVQTKEQYQFIFSAVICMFEQILQGADGLTEKTAEDKTTTTPSSDTRFCQQTDMNDTYAVVNKSKQLHPPSVNPAHSAVATPRFINDSRATPSTHHYDNDPVGASAIPVYSTVKPRAKPISSSHSDTAVYHMAAPSNPRLGEGPLSLCSKTEYHLVSAEHAAADYDEYEEFSHPVTDQLTCSPGAIGFNCRIQKPRGPRDPPAEWSRLDR